MEENMVHFGDEKGKKRQYGLVEGEEKKIYINVDTIIKKVKDVS